MSKPSLTVLLGIDKVINGYNIIKDNGGIFKSLYMAYRIDDLKSGKLMGIDKYGNKYYENRRYFLGTNRWVVYADHVGLNYDASQISAEWYGWMHYKTDYVPYEDPTRPVYPWMLDHKENMSGTPEAYIGYSTPKPKIEAWIPPRRNKAQ